MEYNVAADLNVVAIPQRPTRHHPFLRMEELPALLRSVRAYHNKTFQRGLRLLLFTGVRTCELLHATPEQFDLERGLWSIPPENVKQLQQKMRKAGQRPQDLPPYVVPLSTQAVEIVRELLDACRPGQRYLFANRKDPEKCLGMGALNTVLVRQMGYGGRLTGHGLRGTLSTALNEIGYPRAWIEAQLSHSDRNQVSAAYNHAEYVEQRRRMMQDWADRLDLLEEGRIEEASRHLGTHLESVPEKPATPSPVSRDLIKAA